MLIPVDHAVDRSIVRALARLLMPRSPRRAHRRPRAEGVDDAGFGLVELMIALFVFALLASGFAMTLGGTLKAFQRSRVKTLAEQIANDRLEDARRMPYDDLGNPGGNPPGTVPVTQSENIGGYEFTVTSQISLVDPPADISVQTGADYKMIVVTVASTTGAPPVSMSTYVAPPAKPAADKGRVGVTVIDIGGGATKMPNVTVKLVSGTTIRTGISDASGVVVFSAVLPGTYYVTGVLPAGYWVYPTSDYTRPGSLNLFHVEEGVNYTKNLNIYKAASVSVSLVDAQGKPVLDTASLTVSATSITEGSLGSQTFTIPAGGTTTFDQVAGVGVIPWDASPGYHYTFDVDAGAGCVSTLNSYTNDSTKQLRNENYPTETSFALAIHMPCAYDEVRLHVVDDIDGTAVAGAAVHISGGPQAIDRIVNTDSNGNATLLVRASDTSPYTVTVAVPDGRYSDPRTFTAGMPDPTSPDVKVVIVPDLRVKWPTKTITVTLTGGFTNTPLSGEFVQITGGPTATVFTGVTSATGVYAVSVPYGVGFPAYTITVPPDTVGRAGVTGTATSTSGNVAVTLTDPWTSTMAVAVHVIDTNGADVANRTVTLSLGPPSVGATYTKTYSTDATGHVSITVPCGTPTAPDYQLDAAPKGAKAGATATFSSLAPGPGIVTLTVGA